MTAASGPRRFAQERIEGSGFALRSLTGGDVDDITLACQDVETLRWLPLPKPYLRAHAEGFVNEIAPREHDRGVGIVFGIEVDGRLHGCIDLKGTDWASLVTEIGYWIAPWGRGRGLAARAAARLGAWAIEQGMERVVIRAATGNDASKRAAERAGFTLEGTARNAGYVRDGRVDLDVYSLTPMDLTAASQRCLLSSR